MTTRPQEIKTVANNDRKSVHECMTKNPEYLTPQASIKEAALTMASLDTGSLPVGNKEKLLGFITDRDIAIRAVANGLDPEKTAVEEVMTDEVLYCFEDNDLEAVADNMRDNGVLRLVVLDHNKKFRGIVTHSQIAKAAIEMGDTDLCRKVTELACYDKIF